ncbi:MAG TPA: hypothetical protein VNK94_12565 [Gaiellaceae bacterium]|nr:hypothetical protein [Gaiellaceae bacterium]
MILLGIVLVALALLFGLTALAFAATRGLGEPRRVLVALAAVFSTGAALLLAAD